MRPRRIEDAFSMAAFLAFLELRSFRADHPLLSEAEAVASLVNLRSRAIGLDFRGGITLFRALDSSVDWNSTTSHLRNFVFEWTRLVQPPWLRFVPFGRQRVRKALDIDHAQCFRAAGLFDEVPDDETVQWWDRVAALMRGVSDEEKMMRARLAERLSFEHEKRRVKGLGIRDEPKWISLEDNSLGYDILSYDRDKMQRTVTRLVEVKSTLTGSIFLTRNEWRNASSAAQRAVIHVWYLPQKKLHEYRPCEIAHNIPVDQGSGAWQDVEIELDPQL